MQDRASRVAIQFAPETKFEVEPSRAVPGDSDLPQPLYRELTPVHHAGVPEFRGVPHSALND